MPFMVTDMSRGGGGQYVEGNHIAFPSVHYIHGLCDLLAPEYLEQQSLSVKVKIHVNIWQKSCKSRTRLHLDFFPILKHLPD